MDELSFSSTIVNVGFTLLVSSFPSILHTCSRPGHNVLLAHSTAPTSQTAPPHGPTEALLHGIRRLAHIRYGVAARAWDGCLWLYDGDNLMRAMDELNFSSALPGPRPSMVLRLASRYNTRHNGLHPSSVVPLPHRPPAGRRDVVDDKSGIDGMDSFTRF